MPISAHHTSLPVCTACPPVVCTVEDGGVLRLHPRGVPPHRLRVLPALVRRVARTPHVRGPRWAGVVVMEKKMMMMKKKMQNN